MSSNVILPPLSLVETAEAVAACVRAGRVPLVFGPPGVAKTAMARVIAPVLAEIFGLPAEEYPAEICVLANYDAVDMGGLPMASADGGAERRLFGAFRRAAEHPRLLVLDEFFSTPPSAQGPAARIVLERVAGEAELHEHTRVITIANPPEQTPGGVQAAAMLINRVIILNCRPEVSEVALYFRDPKAANERLAAAARRIVLDEEAFEARREALAVELSFVVEHNTDLVCFDPPEASITDGAPFASPRALDAMISVLAAIERDTGDDRIVQAIAEGAVGQAAATKYLAIRKARARLPSVAEVLAAPDTATVPGDDERDLQLAAISLVLQAARKDTASAWVYLDRFPDEFIMSIAKPMAVTWKSDGSGRWDAAGREILLGVTAWTTRLGSGDIEARRPRHHEKARKGGKAA
jgi:MoxR-like ATPase